MTVKQDGEQGGRDGDAAAHQGDVGERRQQLRRDGGLGQLLWEESVAGGWMHGNGPHPGSVRDVPDLSSMLPGPTIRTTVLAGKKLPQTQWLFPCSQLQSPPPCENLPSLTL